MAPLDSSRLLPSSPSSFRRRLFLLFSQEARRLFLAEIRFSPNDSILQGSDSCIDCSKKNQGSVESGEMQWRPHFLHFINLYAYHDVCNAQKGCIDDSV